MILQYIEKNCQFRRYRQIFFHKRYGTLSIDRKCKIQISTLNVNSISIKYGLFVYYFAPIFIFTIVLLTSVGRAHGGEQNSSKHNKCASQISG